jgi:hypothetical protein
LIFQDVKNILSKHKKQLIQKGVRALAVFGSIARNQGTSKSDVDILIDYDSRKGLFFFVELKNYLEDLLDCEVDLVTKNALHPALKKRILAEAKDVF